MNRPCWLPALWPGVVGLALAACTAAPAGPSPAPTPVGSPAVASPVPAASASVLPVASAVSAAPAPSASAIASGQALLPAAPASGDTLQKLVDGARSEGSLVLVWGSTTIGGQKTVQAWADDFNKTYGLNVDVQFTPGPSMPEMATKTVQEYQAHLPASTDVLLGVDAHMMTAYQGDALVQEDWASWAPNVQDPQLVAPAGIAVEVDAAIPGITYNTDKVSRADVPTSLQDLLKPVYKGRIGTGQYSDLWADLATPGIWGEDRTRAYLQQFAQQIGGLYRTSDDELVATGQFDLFAINSNDWDARLFAAKGEPVAQSIPTDAGLVQFRYMAVPKNAAHPDAAKLFINYVLGRSAQDILYQTASSDLYLVPGSHTAPGIDQAKAAGTVFHDIDVQFFLQNDPATIQSDTTQFEKILEGQ